VYSASRAGTPGGNIATVREDHDLPLPHVPSLAADFDAAGTALLLEGEAEAGRPLTLAGGGLLVTGAGVGGGVTGVPGGALLIYRLIIVLKDMASLLGLVVFL